MENKRSIEVNTFQIHQKFKKDKIFRLDNLQEKSLFVLIQSGFTGFVDQNKIDDIHRKTFPWATDSNGKTVIKIDPVKRIFAGVLDIGEYGRNRPIFGIKEEEGQQDLEQEGEIGLLQSVGDPFFFMLIFPPTTPTVGYAFFEKVRGKSAGNQIRKFVIDFVKKEFPHEDGSDFKPILKFRPYVDDKVVEHYLKDGKYKSIKFTRKFLSNEIAVRYNLGNVYTEDFNLELTIKANRNKYISTNAKNKILSLIGEHPDGFFEYDAFSEIGFDNRSTTVTVNSEYGGKAKNIQIENQKIRPSYEIDLTLDSNGNPNFKSIYNNTIELAESFKLDIFNHE